MLSTLAEVCRTVRVPVVAIGGLTAERAVLAYDAGATWVAAISAVSAAADVTASARAFMPGVRP